MTSTLDIKKWLFALAVTVPLIFSCSKYQQALKSSDMEEKWKTAVDLYEHKNYSRALPLFEELIPYVKGTSRAEQLYFFYAYAHFGIEDYQSAYYFFDNFVGTFPNSKYTEEGAFMLGYSLYKDSPRYNLDPTSTYRAINELQSFANRYPRSARVEDCNKLIEELRGKLETKTYRLAMLYYHIENYQSAIIAFKNFTKDFPDTKLDADANYFILLSAYKYAYGSIEKKKRERFNDVVKYYYTFVERFPTSAYKKSADDLFARSTKEIEEIDARDQLRLQEEARNNEELKLRQQQQKDKALRQAEKKKLKEKEQSKG